MSDDCKNSERVAAAAQMWLNCVQNMAKLSVESVLIALQQAEKNESQYQDWIKKIVEIRIMLHGALSASNTLAQQSADRNVQKLYEEFGKLYQLLLAQIDQEIMQGEDA